MSDLAHRLAELTVDVASPDGHVTATVIGGARLSVRIDPASYPRYTDEQLAHQLSQLGALMWVRYRQAAYEVLRDVVGDDLVDDEGEDRDRRRRLEQLTATATAPGGAITIRTRALLAWDVSIADGTIRTLPAAQFVAELQATIGAVVHDHFQQTYALRYAAAEATFWRDLLTA